MQYAVVAVICLSIAVGVLAAVDWIIGH